MILSIEIWAGAILGAVLGSIVIPLVGALMKRLSVWWTEKRPPIKLLEGISDQSEPCKIFVRDFFIDR